MKSSRNLPIVFASAPEPAPPAGDDGDDDYDPWVDIIGTFTRAPAGFAIQGT